MSNIGLKSPTLGGCVLLAANGAGAGIFIVIGVFYLTFVVLTIAAWVKILTKAGYSGWWILIGLVPLVNMIMFFVFAFSDWPALRATRQYQAGSYQPSRYQR